MFCFVRSISMNTGSHPNELKFLPGVLRPVFAVIHMGKPVFS